ncbi:unnamed protein product [Parnassius mnemosyne]|uniref:Uncharacterized protein n=1 Tax=Parnassius mnemosyne TaxID=213953 RepID=A0AAV1KYN0_9NEOP
MRTARAEARRAHKRSRPERLEAETARAPCSPPPPAAVSASTLPSSNNPTKRLDENPITYRITLEIDSKWTKTGDWKDRYIKLYSSQNTSSPKREESSRISFMSNNSDPYTMLLQRMRSFECDSESKPESSSPLPSTLESAKSELYSTNRSSEQSDLGVHDTMLLDLVRMKSCDIRESQDKTLELPKDHDNEFEDVTCESCAHGLSMRMTERSISRSRVSRVSTRRDMDIPSILAFNAMVSTPQAPNGIPAFERTPSVQLEPLPKWSIRRSICPVCSQKWKDRSSLANIKYSGLKRNTSNDLPTVTVPARLKTSITREFTPRPLSPSTKDIDTSRSNFRNTSATWQLVRARRLRIPKSYMYSEDTAPNSTALLTRIDLDQRVKKFLSRNQV